MVEMPKWQTALLRTSRDAKRKKASCHEKDSAQQVQESLTPMQGATCTNVGAAVVNTPAISPGQQLQVATFGMPESLPEQPVQTR